MEDILVNCNHCGNLMETQLYKRIEICPYCNTRLEIIKMGSSTYTKIYEDEREDVTVAELSKKSITQRNNKRLEFILFNQGIDKEIMILEEQWEQDVEKFSKSGLLPTRSNKDHTIGVMIVSGIGLLLTIVGIIKGLAFVLLLGIIIILYGVLNYKMLSDKTNSYFIAKKQYDQKYNELKNKLKVIPKSFLK